MLCYSCIRSTTYLPMYLRGQRTRAPCAVECNMPQKTGSKLGLGTSASNNKFLQIFPMHMVNNEIIPGRKKSVRRVLYNMWPLLTPWITVSGLLAMLTWLKLKGVAGHWLVQHTAPVWAKPDGRPCLNRFFNVPVSVLKKIQVESPPNGGTKYRWCKLKDF